jgi:hypothetical protein
MNNKTIKKNFFSLMSIAETDEFDSEGTGECNLYRELSPRPAAPFPDSTVCISKHSNIHP